MGDFGEVQNEQTSDLDVKSTVFKELQARWWRNIHANQDIQTVVSAEVDVHEEDEFLEGVLNVALEVSEKDDVCRDLAEGDVGGAIKSMKAGGLDIKLVDGGYKNRWGDDPNNSVSVRDGSMWVREEFLNKEMPENELAEVLWHDYSAWLVDSGKLTRKGIAPCPPEPIVMTSGDRARGLVNRIFGARQNVAKFLAFIYAMDSVYEVKTGNNFETSNQDLVKLSDFVEV